MVYFQQECSLKREPEPEYERETVQVLSQKTCSPTEHLSKQTITGNVVSSTVGTGLYDVILAC